jgi:hypothetical protein
MSKPDVKQGKSVELKTLKAETVAVDESLSQSQGVLHKLLTRDCLSSQYFVDLVVNFILKLGLKFGVGDKVGLRGWMLGLGVCTH